MKIQVVIMLIGLSLVNVALLVITNPVLAQPSTANKTSENFKIEYNHTNLADCEPNCVNMSIEYDSETNRLSLRDWMRPEDVVTVRELTDEQEKVLETSVSPLQFADFKGSGVCQIGTIYCETSSITFTRNGKSHTALWSMLSESILDNLNNAGNLLRAIALANQNNTDAVKNKVS